MFGPAVRDEFGLSHTAWSGIYMAGTLLSAALLPWSGRQIDQIALRRYAVLVCAGLALAAAFMALVPTAALLVVAIFLLRQAGQGLASHTGTVAMARHFDAHRGKAVALVSLGFALGEAVLPFLAVLAIAAVGWRSTYGGAAVLLVLGLTPAVWGLLHSHARLDRLRRDAPAATGATPSWTRADVLRHWRFYVLLPAVLAPSFIVTALFFHHLTLAETKGWGADWITGSYWLFALGAVTATLFAGPLIDRISAVRVLPAFLLPLAVGLLIIALFDGRFWAWPYLLCVGLSTGIAHTAVSALWAEVYGVGHLGAIRSLAMSLSVFSSALGPLAMGALMDAGVAIATICIGFALYCLAATVLMAVAFGGRRAPAAESP